MTPHSSDDAMDREVDETLGTPMPEVNVVHPRDDRTDGPRRPRLDVTTPGPNVPDLMQEGRSRRVKRDRAAVRAFLEWEAGRYTAPGSVTTRAHEYVFLLLRDLIRDVADWPGTEGR